MRPLSPLTARRTAPVVLMADGRDRRIRRYGGSWLAPLASVALLRRRWRGYNLHQGRVRDTTNLVGCRHHGSRLSRESRSECRLGFQTDFGIQGPSDGSREPKRRPEWPSYNAASAPWPFPGQPKPETMAGFSGTSYRRRTTGCMHSPHREQRYLSGGKHREQIS